MYKLALDWTKRGSFGNDPLPSPWVALLIINFFFFFFASKLMSQMLAYCTSGAWTNLSPVTGLARIPSNTWCFLFLFMDLHLLLGYKFPLYVLKSELSPTSPPAANSHLSGPYTHHDSLTLPWMKSSLLCLSRRHWIIYSLPDRMNFYSFDICHLPRSFPLPYNLHLRKTNSSLTLL